MARWASYGGTTPTGSGLRSQHRATGRLARQLLRSSEPQGPAASLARVPDGNDLLSFRNRLALGLGAFGLFGGLGVGVLAFLRSAVWPIAQS